MLSFPLLSCNYFSYYHILSLLFSLVVGISKPCSLNIYTHIYGMLVDLNA